jgi:hypothetical protein
MSSTAEPTSPTTPPGNTVLLWDFFGPAAPGTAEHFEIHLREFLAREGLAALITGLGSEAANHVAVWCEATAEAEATLVRALRPKRRSAQRPAPLPDGVLPED